MKKVSLIVLVMVMACVAASAILPTKGFVAPKTLVKDGIGYVPSAPSGNPAKADPDSIFGDTHTNSCYISSVRCIDTDPVANVTFVILRTQSTGNVFYIGTGDDGANWTSQGPLAPLSIRYPGAMADIQNARPWIMTNTGWASGNEGVWAMYDEGGYNTGIWTDLKNIDTLGNGVANAAFYCANGYKGSNGTIHAVSNYWGTATPEAFFYFKALDPDGNSWDLSAPRAEKNLKMFSLNGTEDSINIFGPSNPVIHDSLTPGFINQVEFFATASGETLMVGSCGIIDTSDNVTDRGKMRYWYRMSYDNGTTWTPFTWAPHGGWLGWPGDSYDLGIGIDKQGYPHFASFLWMDTTDYGELYGPRTGLYDYHLTAQGWVATQICTTKMTGTGKVAPRFANVGQDEFANLYISYSDDAEGSHTQDIWLAKSENNGASYSIKPVTTNNGLNDYPHLPYRIRGTVGAKIPVFVQQASVAGGGGPVSWVKWVTNDNWPPPQGVAGSRTSTFIGEFKLMPSFPNPSRGLTNFSFTLPRRADYSLKVYNVSGQLVKTLSGDGRHGLNTVPWNGQDNNGKKIANGLYLYKLSAAGYAATGKLVVIR